VAGGWRGRVLDLVAGLVLLYLFVPVFVIVLYSFNKPEGRFNFVWKSFSLDAWRDPFKYQSLVDAMELSLQVAAISTGVAIVFGTLIALALCRYQFRGSSAVDLLLVLPLSLPGVFAGSLLTFIPASGDFINAELLGSPNQQMIGTVIQNQFLEVRDYSLASAVSFVLMVVITLGVFAYARALGTEELA